ncbi:MAG: CDP-alcohol phosphatidyltransferase family protein [Candidatus Planktophila sp.]|nr:CDP-alcohol phosphatidyltransferase family protein [Candidatus Planktophila sp.]
MLTIPNALTFLRFLGIPLFIWLTLDRNFDGWAILVLIIGGATDYFDGKLARALNQESRFGEIADPTIDRLYIAATIIVLYIRDAIPLWVILLLVARDISMAILAFVIQMRGLPTLQVTYLGKAATFNLLYAFPFLLLALNSNWYGTVSFIFGWAFTGWGVALYLATAIGYFRTGINSIRVRPQVI